MSSPQKIERRIEGLADEMGWELSRTSGGSHFQLRHPNPEVPLVHCGTSPSDVRWYENLKAQLKRSERRAKRENGADPTAAPEPHDDSKPPKERPKCRYCEKTFMDGRGLSAHEDGCDYNPDRWIECECGQQCQGVRGLAHHQRHCDEHSDQGDDLPPPIELPKPEVSARKPRPSGGGRREKVRGLLTDLLREYDRLRQNGAGVDDVLSFADTVDATTDLVLEVAARDDREGAPDEAE